MSIPHERVYNSRTMTLIHRKNEDRIQHSLNQRHKSFIHQSVRSTYKDMDRSFSLRRNTHRSVGRPSSVKATGGQNYRTFKFLEREFRERKLDKSKARLLSRDKKQEKPAFPRSIRSLSRKYSLNVQTNAHSKSKKSYKVDNRISSDALTRLKNKHLQLGNIAPICGYRRNSNHPKDSDLVRKIENKCPVYHEKTLKEKIEER